MDCRNRKSRPRSAAAVWALMVTVGLTAATVRAGFHANVQDYFPANWEEDKIDLREYIQQAVEENAMVFFPGSNDADNPVVYRTATGIEVPAYHQLYFGPHHRVKRLPSSGRLITLGDHARIQGAVIDGNKYRHWPEFQDLGKQSDSAVRVGNYTVVKDVVVYNNPGHAFETWGNYNKFYRCLAENIGYLDVRLGEMYYSSRRDRWSGDGFYLRGTGNLVKDSEAYDCQRWDFCSSHSGARQNTYVDCRGGDVEFISYGFIDIEDADGNNRLIRCISPNSHIAIPVSARTEVIQCMASRITAWDREESIDLYADDAGIRNHGLLLDGNITTEGGIVIGGWSSRRNSLVPGAASPIVVNNRMYKSHPEASDGYSDWSFSIHANDGHGAVANNILFEYDDGERRGPGLNIDGIEGHNNQVLYGVWDLDLPRISLTYGYYDYDHILNRAQARGQESLEEYLQQIEFDRPVAEVQWLAMEAPFIQDPDEEGESRNWHQRIPVEEPRLITLPVTGHWDFVIGTYHGTGWYYFEFDKPENLNDANPYFFFAGIDSEARIYLNGELIGRHSGWDIPSLHEIQVSLLTDQDDPQLLTVAVTAPTGLGGIYAPVGIVLAGE